MQTAQHIAENCHLLNVRWIGKEGRQELNRSAHLVSQIGQAVGIVVLIRRPTSERSRKEFWNLFADVGVINEKLGALVPSGWQPLLQQGAQLAEQSQIIPKDDLRSESGDQYTLSPVGETSRDERVVLSPRVVERGKECR